MKDNITKLITDYLSANNDYLILDGFSVDEIADPCGGEYEVRMIRGAAFGGDLEWVSVSQLDLMAWVYSKVGEE